MYKLFAFFKKSQTNNYRIKEAEYFQIYSLKFIVQNLSLRDKKDIKVFFFICSI